MHFNEIHFYTFLPGFVAAGVVWTALVVGVLLGDVTYADVVCLTFVVLAVVLKPTVNGSSGTMVLYPDVVFSRNFLVVVL